MNDEHKHEMFLYRHGTYLHSKVAEHALDNKRSPGYWQLHAESTFLSCSFAMDQLLVEHNEKFYFL